MIRDRDPVYTAVRAVDVGYFGVKYTLGRKQQGDDVPIATAMFPSLAPRLQSSADYDTPAARKADGCVVDVGGARYFVGREAAYNSTASEPRPVLENYAKTPRYLALFRGGLHYMLVDAGNPAELTIGHAVLGLPMTTFASHRVELAQRILGEHVIAAPEGGARRVTIERVHVIPQPHGALLNFSSSLNGQLEGWTLVVDIGGGTVDWYCGMKGGVNWQRCGAHNKGMLACAAAVAKALDHEDWLDQFEVMEWIDEAIRTGKKSFQVEGVEYELAPHRDVIEAVMAESVEKMLAKVGPLGNIKRILLTGGGAPVFGEFMKRKYQNLNALLHIDRDPIYSNVRGFQVYGELEHAKSGTTNGRSR